MWCVINYKDQNLNKRWNFKLRVLSSEYKVSPFKTLSLKFWNLFWKAKKNIFEIVKFL